MRIAPRSLNAQLILLVSATLLVSGAISGWVTSLRQSATLVSNMDAHSSVMVKNFAETSAYYLVLQDFAGLETFLLKSAELPDITGIQVCEPSGVLVVDIERARGVRAKVRPSGGRISPPLSGAPVIAHDRDSLSVWQPIKAGNMLGWVKATYSLADIQRARTETIGQSLLLAMVWAGGSSILLLLFLRPMVRSFGRLTQFASQLDEHKGEQMTIDLGSEEMVRLAASLNSASTKLHVSEQQLVSDRERVRKSEENYKLLLDTIQEGIWVIDKDSVTTFVNPRMAEILGYTTQEMIGQLLFSFMDEQGKVVAVRNVERRKQGIKEQHDFEFIRSDGTRIYTRLETGPILDATGQYTGAIAAVADVTERKRAEEALRQSESHYRQLFENMQEGFLIQELVEDDAGNPVDVRYLDVNPAMERFIGKTRREILGRTQTEVLSTPDPAVVEANYHVVTTGQPFHMVRYSAGASRWYESYSYLLSPKQVATLLVDITERKQAEEAIQKMNEQLEQRVKERTSELEAKIAEIERMNKLFIGRELKMVELKQQIKTLEDSASAQADRNA